MHTFKFERLKGLNPFLAGSQVSLADCYLAPIFGYLTMTPSSGERRHDLLAMPAGRITTK